MKTLGLVEPQMLVVAAFSRHPDVLDRAAAMLVEVFGPLLAASPRWPFEHTRYYARTMGEGLVKQLFSFTQLAPMDSLADIKCQTIEMEASLHGHGYPESRPLNLDPGFLGLGKFVLATTKDQAHRIYLRRGIFAEVTLQFQDGHFRPNPWTYPDYRTTPVLIHLDWLRDEYRKLRQPPADSG